MINFKPQIPNNRELHGGDLLAQALKHLGVEVAFGLHGGHLDAFLVGAEEASIKLVDTRHETVAVQAAEGYAKVSGKVGVCFVTANSGYAAHAFNKSESTSITHVLASAMACPALPRLSRIVRQSS